MTYKTQLAGKSVLVFLDPVIAAAGDKPAEGRGPGDASPVRQLPRMIVRRRIG